MDRNEIEKQSFASVVNRFDTTNTSFLIYQCGWQRTTKETLPRRESKTFSLHYIISGEVVIEYKNKKYILGEGNCFLLRTGRSMVYYPNPENPASYYWFSVTGGLAAGFFDNMGFNDDNFYFLLSDEYKEKIHDAFARAMILAKERKKSAHIFLYRGFHEICENLTMFIPETSSSDINIPFLSAPMIKALELIEKNYTNPDFSLQHLAELMGYNPSYLSRLFKKEIGINFKSYIIQKRMHYAAILLREGERNMNVIAEKVGLHDVPYFRTLYKKLNSPNKIQISDTKEDKNKSSEEK